METAIEKSQNLVSVLMPAYNAEAFLGEAIESVLGQSYSNFELLIIYDESTDRTSEIIDAYCTKDPRVRKVTHPKRNGLAAALNVGVNEAKGNLIARFDADDICVVNRLETQIEFLTQHSDVVVVGSDFETFGKNIASSVVSHPDHPLEVAWKFGWNTRVGHPTVMYKKTVVLGYGGYANLSAEDFDLFSRIAQEQRVSNIKKVLVRYRVHEKNKSLKEKIFVDKELLQIASRLLRGHGVPQELHPYYVQFHWNIKCPNNILPKLIFWNLIVILNLRKKLGYRTDLYVNLLLLPKFILILARRTYFQISGRATEPRLESVET